MKRFLSLLLGCIAAIAESFRMCWQLMRTGEVKVNYIVEGGDITQNGHTRPLTEEEKDAYRKACSDIFQSDWSVENLQQSMDRMDAAMRSVHAAHQAANEAQARAEEILRTNKG